MKSRFAKIFGVALTAALLLTMIVVPPASAAAQKWSEIGLPSVATNQLSDGVVIKWFVTEGKACEDGTIFAVGYKEFDRARVTGWGATGPVVKAPVQSMARIYKSTDGGYSWTLAIDATKILGWKTDTWTSGWSAFAPYSPFKYYAPIVDVVFSGKDANTVYITDGDSIFKSINFGTTWTSVNKLIQGTAGNLKNITDIEVAFNGNQAYIIAAATPSNGIDSFFTSTGNVKVGIYVLVDGISTALWSDAGINSQRVGHTYGKGYGVTSGVGISVSGGIFVPIVKIYHIAVDSNFDSTGAISVFYLDKENNVCVTSADVLRNGTWNYTYKDEMIFNNIGNWCGVYTTTVSGPGGSSTTVDVGSGSTPHCVFWTPDWTLNSNNQNVLFASFNTGDARDLAYTVINGVVTKYKQGLYQVVTNGSGYIPASGSGTSTITEKTNYASLTNLNLPESKVANDGAATPAHVPGVSFVTTFTGAKVGSAYHIAAAMDRETVAGVDYFGTDIFYANVSVLGFNWQVSINPPAGEKVNDMVFRAGFTGTAPKAGLIVATENDPAYVANSGAGVYVSENAGRTFVGCAFLQINFTGTTIKDLTTDGTNVYFLMNDGTNSYIWRQSGAWALVFWTGTSTVSPAVYDRVYVNYAEDEFFMWLSTASAPDVQVSTNYGMTFTAIAIQAGVNGSVLAVNSIGNETVYIITSEGMYVSYAHTGAVSGFEVMSFANGTACNTFTTVSSAAISVFGNTIVAALYTNATAVTANNIFFISTDGGAKWYHTSYTSVPGNMSGVTATFVKGAVAVNGLVLTSASLGFLAVGQNLYQMNFEIASNAGSAKVAKQAVFNNDHNTAATNAAPATPGFKSMAVSDGFVYVNGSNGKVYRWNGTVAGGTNVVELFVDKGTRANGDNQTGLVLDGFVTLTSSTSGINVWAFAANATASSPKNTIWTYTDTLIKPVTGVTISEVSTNSAKVSWTAMNNADKFNKWGSTAGDDFSTYRVYVFDAAVANGFDFHRLNDTYITVAPIPSQTNDAGVQTPYSILTGVGVVPVSTGVNLIGIWECDGTSVYLTSNGLATGTGWLAENTRYYVYVVSLNPLSSLVSSSSNFITYPGPVAWLTYQTNLGNNNSLLPTLNWGSGSNPTNGSTGTGYDNATYWVQVSKDNTFAAASIVYESKTLTTNYVIIPASAGLKADTGYFWRVCYANNAAPTQWGAWTTGMFQTGPEFKYTDNSTITNNHPVTNTVNVPDPGTPVWVWVIIAIGTILTIAVIVLIFRTRRVS